MSKDGYQGNQQADSGSSEYNVQEFIIQSLIAKIATAKLVKIIKVTNSGGVSAVGFVDVKPLVNQIDGANKSYPHGVIYNLPYFRLQGGANAVILDPQVDDIGVAIFSDRDISAVKVNKKESNPGSNRKYDMADGLYIGGFLNGVPIQYIRFSTSGIEVKSTTEIKFIAPTLKLDGNVESTGTFKNNTINIGSTHVHAVTTAPGTTGTPT